MQTLAENAALAEHKKRIQALKKEQEQRFTEQQKRALEVSVAASRLTN